jgi:hypothetical protein
MEWEWWKHLFGWDEPFWDDDETDSESKPEGTMDKKDLQRMLDEAVRMAKQALRKNGIPSGEQSVVALAKMVLKPAIAEYNGLGDVLLEEEEK